MILFPFSTDRSLLCGNVVHQLNPPKGSIQTLNWPNKSYPINVNCSWSIECPAGNTIRITFDPIFRIAGRMPACSKDQVEILSCGGVLHGPFCHLTAPRPFLITSNKAQVMFHAGSKRGVSRIGFQLNYECIIGALANPTICQITTPTAPPTTPPTTSTAPPSTTSTTPTTLPICPSTQLQAEGQSHSQEMICGGGNKFLSRSNGSIQTLNWPYIAYPLNINCRWTINCLPSQRIFISFEKRFRVAGDMPACEKDQLYILDQNGRKTLGPFCHLTAPPPLTTFCSRVDVVFHTGSSRGKSRTGFKLNYQCI